ncbi:MAG: DUF4365 domain-containing protein [Candidatus Zixiibacteriota bacterium]|nr:MAG: DUF4365 domain-containing protein [candidate division Zixibacteria bacterium]
MTKRTDTHVISSTALAQIRKIVSKAGFKTEPAKKDDGEDLIINTFCDAKTDAFRILIRVIGTRRLRRYRSKKYGVSIILPADHILKWIRSPETIIVVLWDVEKKSGFWAIPDYEFDTGEIIIEKNNNTRLVFPSRNKFNAAILKRLVWKIRVSHYNTIVKSAFRDLENPELPEKYRQQKRIKIYDIGNLFLNYIGAFSNCGIERDLINGLRSLKEIIPENLLIQSALILAILKKTGDRIGECLPFDLLKACVLAVESITNYKQNNN